MFTVTQSYFLSLIILVLHIVVLWGMVPHGLEGSYHCFVGTQCVQLHGRLHNPEDHSMNLHYAVISDTHIFSPYLLRFDIQILLPYACYFVCKGFNTGLFIRPSGISELDCATTKTDTAESISIGRESLQVSVLPYRCLICAPLVTRQMSIL